MAIGDKQEAHAKQFCIITHYLSPITNSQFFERDRGAVLMAEPLGGRGALAHRPVLLRETIELLAAERGGLFVDCTVGLGGHSEAILQAAADSEVFAIDRDEEALQLARKRLAQFGGRFRAVHADFRELTRVLARSEVSN